MYSFKDYKVGDLLQAKGGFIGEWINHQVFIIANIDNRKEDAFTLICQSNNRILETSAFTLNRDMVKLNDV